MHTSDLDGALSDFEFRPCGSPFVRYRQVVFAGYSAAETLRMLVMSMCDGNAYPFAAHRLRDLDMEHFEIVVEMMMAYNARGENDAAFMDLAQSIEASGLVKKRKSRRRLLTP
ncbi:hypothetical protein EGT07_18110 [Herbaspirillum sp. HC18]|nr:hypothetical protein EGT07_18110 [Herbaspirillum sp. HC18]